MKPSSSQIRPWRLHWLALLVMCISFSAGAATVGPTLADSPIGSSVVVPANVVLDLSVEFPTADSDSYYFFTTYVAATTYVGYYNPNYCYTYTTNSTYSGIGTGASNIIFGSLAGYFVPFGPASTHVCTGHWSGNFLNWATTQTIDPLRRALTGGARIVDTSAITVLQKAYADSQASTGNQLVKTITQANGGGGSQGVATALIAGATPFTNWTSIYTSNFRTGLNFVFSQSPLTSGTAYTGTSFAGVSVASVQNGGTCSTTSSGSGSASSGNPVSSNYTVSDNPSAMTITQGCTGSSTITVGYVGTTFNGNVAFTVTGLPSGVTASSLPTATKASPSNTLTLTASNTATVGTSTVSIKGTSGTKSATVTIALTIAATPAMATYNAQSAVQVCTSGELSGSVNDIEGSGGRCRGYPYDKATISTYSGSKIYKPFGLMQKYAAESTIGTDSIRYAVASYMQDPTGDTANAQLDAGVLRAKMKSVGPFKANPGAAVVSNTNGEWDANTGVFAVNPNPADATATAAVTGPTPTNSGALNYLNKFGFVNSGITYSSATSSPAYKTYDSVSELFYTATRYFRNLGNLTFNTSGATAISSGAAKNDGFPVITTWDDPIAYSCSTNYVIGIGDQHTWNDGDVPGSTLNGGNESNGTAVGTDRGVNATTATNYIGNLEHVAGYTGAGVVPGSTPNNGSDYIQTAALGGQFVNSSTSGNCCTGNTFYLAGLAFDAHVRDIRPDITNKTSPVTVSTFWLDVMEANDYHEKNVFWMAAKYGGFNTNDPSFAGGYPIALNTSGVGPGTAAAAISYSTTLANTPLPVSAWNTSGYVDENNNYSPDNYYEAGNAAGMTSGLDSAFKKINATTPAGTSTALSLNSSSVNAAGNVNYVSSFATDWSGSVVAQKLTLTQTGSVISTMAAPLWDARSWLPPSTGATVTPGVTVTPLKASTRIIATSSAKGAAKGIPFETANIGSAQAATLGGSSSIQANVLNYVRGDQCNEVAAGTTKAGCTAASVGFRPRGTTVLGDITNSKPAVVSAPNFPYADTPLNPGYTAFQSANSTRGTVVYIGANDGMLHAFDGSNSTSGGKELFAYVPSSLFTANTDSVGNPVGLASLTVSPLQHHFMVDSQPVVYDIDFTRTGSGASSIGSSVPSDWHTLVISGLGKGGGSNGGALVGGGYFAIDVTNPSAISSEAALATNVKWETDPSSLTHMGYSYGTPLVVKTKAWGWTVVLTSGYDNDDGKGYIYLVSPKDGSLYQIISTGAGSTTNPAGLTYVTGYINNYADFTADSLYAGDLLGNLWRVDLTSTSIPSSATLMAQLTDPSGTAQPVTTEPVIGTDPNSLTRYVFVGTGRLLADTDLVNPQTETFYAFVDGNNAAFAPVSTAIARSDLANDYNSGTSTVTGVTLTSSQKGFYIDLAAAATAGAGTQASAERINIQPVATGGVTAFAANLYGQNICVKGTSRVFALNYDTSGSTLLGATVLQSAASPSTPVSFLSYSGATTNLAVVTPAPPLSGSSVSSGLMLMVGLDTTAAGASQTPKSDVNGDMLKRPDASLQRLNWREVPSAQ